MARVYILRSIRDGRLYIGSTSNLDQRIQHHAGGHTPTTKRFGETELVFTQEFGSLQEARTIERKLKRLKRKDYLEKIIREGHIKMRA